jgi:hypothetical protein
VTGRAFYRVPVGNVPPSVGRGEDLDVALLHTSGSYHYVLAPEERAEVAAAFGAELLGRSWEEFWDAAPQVREYVFVASIKRDGGPMRARLAEIEEGDVVVASPFAPTRYHGDGAPRRIAR